MLPRFPAAFSEQRGKSFVRKQSAEKITKVLAPRSENAAGKRDTYKVGSGL
jgi:hypothetical protein